MNIGKIVKEERTKQNISQLTLGLAIGNDSAYICKIENNKKEPSLRTIIKIANALNISPLDFLEKIISETE